ncbi:MAG: hypothetical protein WCO52_00200 [bacterium]
MKKVVIFDVMLSGGHILQRVILERSETPDPDRKCDLVYMTGFGKVAETGTPDPDVAAVAFYTSEIVREDWAGYDIITMMDRVFPNALFVVGDASSYRRDFLEAHPRFAGYVHMPWGIEDKFDYEVIEPLARALRKYKEKKNG